MNKQSANIRSSMTRSLASLCGFAVMGFSLTASAVPPPPPPPPVTAPLGATPLPPPSAATPPPALQPTTLAPPPPPPSPERPTPAPGYAPPVPNSGWDNTAPPPLSWRPADPGFSPMWPLRVDYEDGDVVPPGYEVKTRAEKGLLVGGVVTFAVPYGISFLIGGLIAFTGGNRDQEEFGPLLIPVVGPFITMGQWDSIQEDGAFIMLANGFAQTAGAAMIVSSLLLPEKYLERMAKLPGKPEVFVGAGSTTVRLRF